MGAPKVYPQYGDNAGAWAMANCDANEYLEVSNFSIERCFHWSTNCLQMVC